MTAPGAASARLNQRQAYALAGAGEYFQRGRRFTRCCHEKRDAPDTA